MGETAEEPMTTNPGDPDAAEETGQPYLQPRNSKIEIIRDALDDAGHDLGSADEGSPEWIKGSRAYERMLPVVLAQHNWKFRTQIGDDLARIGASNYPAYTDIYEMPGSCLHLISAWDKDAAAMTPDLPQFWFSRQKVAPPRLDYQVIGGHIHCSAPNGIAALFVPFPANDLEWPALFREAFVRAISSVLHKSLNDDIDAADKAEQQQMFITADAKARTDNQEPRKAMFRTSRTRHTRRG
jgi:hypothetical protein